MKITASRKDDILKRKAEYDARRKAYDDAEQEAWDRYQDAEDAVTEPIKSQIENMLRRFTALHFDVQVQRGWSSRRNGRPGIDVKISCNERNLNDPDVALGWRWEASLDSDGAVKKESSSWSGLQACTEEQLRSLEQTFQALKLLNSIDWSVVLDVKLPKYSDYKMDLPERPATENFEDELKEAELEELIGKNAAVEVYNWESSPYRGDSVYLQILRETPSQYVCKIFPRTHGRLDQEIAELIRSGQYYGYEQRVRKSTIVFTENPPHIIEF